MQAFDNCNNSLNVPEDEDNPDELTLEKAKCLNILGKVYFKNKQYGEAI